VWWGGVAGGGVIVERVQRAEFVWVGGVGGGGGWWGGGWGGGGGGGRNFIVRVKIFGNDIFKIWRGKYGERRPTLI